MTKNYKIYNTLNILFTDENNNQRCLYLKFAERWGYVYEDWGLVDYKYNRCMDTKGRKGLDRWINRTWEMYYGQNALLNYIEKVKDELGEANYKKLFDLVRRENVLSSRYEHAIDLDKNYD